MGESVEAPEWTVRKLLRAARQGTLSTQNDGQPFAALATPAIDSDGAILLLLSDLSEHTRHLRTEPRCALIVWGSPVEANPQTAPRVTVLGHAAIDDAPALRERYLAVHPYAALYAGFGDFHLWRIAPRSASFVGGFARAFRFSAEALAPDPAGRAAIEAARADIVAHCNADHADTMALLAEAETGAMVDVDTDGCDILAGETVQRVPWEKPVSSANDVRRELIRLARTARRG